jgi:flagellar protein FlbT
VVVDAFDDRPGIRHGGDEIAQQVEVGAVPNAWPIIEGINNHILSGELYLALKQAKKLIAYERELLDQIEAMNAAKPDVSSAA